jgi:hypothetical protein
MLVGDGGHVERPHYAKGRVVEPVAAVAVAGVVLTDLVVQRPLHATHQLRLALGRREAHAGQRAAARVV